VARTPQVPVSRKAGFQEESTGGGAEGLGLPEQHVLHICILTYCVCMVVSLVVAVLVIARNDAIGYVSTKRC